MAASSDSDEEETFVSLGTPLEIPDKDEPIKKPINIQDMQAKDSRGRARFHGAFTGGFSAGYFNSVGSKEGWAPSTFISSRSSKAEPFQQQSVEDFMDDEDVGEHGIAPRKIVTAGKFTSEERKRRRQQEVLVTTSDSVLPGQSALMDLIVPERITIGMKLLRKMGWKDGQGVGPRLSRKQRKKRSSAQKTYGCALPPSPSSDDDDDCGLDDDTFLKDITYAPRDTAHILLAAKDNTHGLGYRGINPHLALSSSSRSGHVNLFEPPAVRKSGRKGIRGQGFGVGALEEDDEDIYGVDDMSRYDMTMGGEEEDRNFGWTAPRGKGSTETPVGYVGRVLEGFKLSDIKLAQKKDFPPPHLPQGYRPVHKFSTPQQPLLSLTTLTMGAPAGVDYRQFLKPGSMSHDRDKEHSAQVAMETGSQKKKTQLHDAASRSVALGENAFVGSVFDLITLGDKAKMAAAKAGTPLSEEPGTSQGPMNPVGVQNKEIVPILAQKETSSALVPTTKLSTAIQSSSTTTAANSESKLSQDEMRQKNLPLFQGAANSFKPFMKDPAKQQRYEKYQELMKHGHKDAYSLVCSAGQTEWETDREREEFASAARLYKPLMGMMAARFTSGSHNLDEPNTADNNVDSSIDKSDAAKAAEMKMYGQLTRDVAEWHPDKLICKRFNIPDPYPGSSIVGLATVKRDKYSVFNFLDFASPTSTEAANRNLAQTHAQTSETQTPSKEDGVKQSEKEKTKDSSKSIKSIFSHLVDPPTKGQQSGKSVSFTVKSSKPSQAKGGFKSIFSHLEDEPVMGRLKPTEKSADNITENAAENRTENIVEVKTEKTANVEKSNESAQTNKVSDAVQGVVSVREAGDNNKEISKEVENQPPVDLFRAIFKNTDSEGSSSSSEEEMEQESAPVLASVDTVQDPIVKTETTASGSSVSVRDHHMEALEARSSKTDGPSEVAPVKMESLSDRLSVPSDDSEEDTFGPALPPSLSTVAAGESRTDPDIQYMKTTQAIVIDSSSSRSPAQYVDLTKESRKSDRKHKHKDKHKEKHKSKKDKKDKHKKSKHKKKGKKKEKKKERKYESDSSETTDKDSDDSDTGLPSDREILNRFRSLTSAQRMKASDFM